MIFMKKYLSSFGVGFVPFILLAGASIAVLTLIVNLSNGGFGSKSKAVINWLPEKIEQSQFPGTTKIFTAKFTSQKDLENVKFWITPPLKRYTVVEPGLIEKVEKNKEYTIQIIVSLTSDISSGTYSDKNLEEDIGKEDKDLREYLNKDKDSKDYLKGFLKKKIPGLIFVTSEKSVPRFMFQKDKEQKIRTIYPEALRIVINVKKPTAEEIPIDEVSLPTAEKIYKDPETGAVYVRDEILIGFKEGTSEARIKEIIAGVNGIFLGSIIDLDAYQIRILGITDPSQLEPIIQQLEVLPEVRIATYSWIDEVR